MYLRNYLKPCTVAYNTHNGKNHQASSWGIAASIDKIDFFFLNWETFERICSIEGPDARKFLKPSFVGSNPLYKDLWIVIEIQYLPLIGWMIPGNKRGINSIFIGLSTNSSHHMDYEKVIPIAKDRGLDRSGLDSIRVEK